MGRAHSKCLLLRLFWVYIVLYDLFTDMSIPTTANQTCRANTPEPHLPGASATDIACRSLKEAAGEESIPDIEHVPVNDDPYKWSHVRKACSHLDSFRMCTVDNDYSMVDNNTVDHIHGVFDFNSCIEYTKSYVRFCQSSMIAAKSSPG